MALIDQLGAVDPEGVVSGLIADTAPDLVQNSTVDPQSVMNRLIRKGLDSRQQRALQRSQNQPGPEQAPADLSAFGKTEDEVGAQPQQDFSSFGQTEDEIKPKKDEWGGYGSVAARAAAKGAVEGTGHVLKGVGGLLQPPDEPADMGPNGGGPKLDETDLVPKRTTQPQLANPMNPISRAGHAAQEFGEKNIQLSPTEADSITGRTARAVGGFVPFAAGMAAGGLAAGPPGAIAVGAGMMAASSGSAAYDEAIAKGADDATAAKAAGLNAIVGGALGVLPLGVILAPFRATAPGLVGLAATALEKALRAGIVFSTVGEAQEYLGQQIAKGLYDPNAGYSPDAKRIISSFIAGGIIGAATPPYRAPGPAPSPAGTGAAPGGALPGGGPGAGPGGPRGPGERPTGNPRADDPYDPNWQWGMGSRSNGTWYRDDAAGNRWYYDPQSARWEEPNAKTWPPGGGAKAGTGPQGFRTSPGGPGGPMPGTPPPPFESTLRPKLRKTLEAKAAYYKEHSAEDIASWSDDQLKEYVNTKFGGGSAKSTEEPAAPKAEKPKTYKPMDEAEAESTLREFGYDDEFLSKMGADTRRATAEMLRTAYPDGPPRGKAKPQAAPQDIPPEQAPPTAPAEPQSTGTRADPIEVKTAEDVARAAQTASTDYSHEQGEANNRKLGHFEWKGLEGSIEVGAGGTRKGTNPKTGEPWQTTHTVPYGYWKGTIGGDGMHLDVAFGPEPDHGHPVYVIDEKDEKTGKFRQHKTFIGMPTPQAAIDAYLGTSTKKPEHIGGMRVLPEDEFVKWAKSGRTKTALSDAMGKKVPEAAATETGNKVSNETGTSEQGGTGVPPSTGGADKAMADLASMFNEPAAAHHAAVETAVKATGHDPARMRPADMHTAAELIANNGMSPEHAFMVAVAHNLIADGTIKFKDAEQVLGHEAATELLEIGHDGGERQPSAEASGPAAGGPIAATPGGVGPISAQHGEEVPTRGGQPHGEAHGGERPGQQEGVPAANTAGAEDGRGAVGEAAGGERNAKADERGAGEAGKPVGEASDQREQQSGGAAEAAVAPAAEVTLARALVDLIKSDKPITHKVLQQEASKAYGGTMAEGKFDRKDAHDALELAVNLVIKSDPDYRAVYAGWQRPMQQIEKLLARLPTQRVRSEEQQSFQQFSTPPNYSLAAVYVANIRDGETVLEPSAGTGSLVAAANRPGVKIIANELSERRAPLLRELVGKDGRVFTENAEQIDNILPDDVKPTVVVMNPPFSQTAGRMGDRKVLMVAADHIEAALNRLEPGGRLVAIVGKGMAMGAPTYRAWWGKISKDNTVQANVGVEGKVYEKYGTTFGTRLVVIDKVQPVAGHVPVLTEVQTVDDLMRALEPIRNGRAESKPVGIAAERQPAEQSGAPLPAAGAGESTTAPPASAQSGDVGTGERGNGRVAGAGSSGAAEPSGKPVRLEAGERAPLDHVEPERPGAGGAGERTPGNAAGRERAQASGGAGAERDLQPPAGGQPGAAASSERVELEQTAKPGTQAKAEISDSLYDAYEPQRVRVKGAKPHPGPLVQSAAMASVAPPTPKYQPRLPKAVIEDGKLSIAQLEAVIYAGQAHQAMLPAGESQTPKRRGFFIGDGTGVGKGREVAGIILDNWQQGRTKAVWVSEKKTLLHDAKRDWMGLGGEGSVLFDVGKVKAGEPVKAQRGIGFITYDTLKGGISDQAAIARGQFIRKQQVSVNGQAGAVQRIQSQGRNNPPLITVKLENGTEITVPGNEVNSQQSMKVKSRVDQLVDWFGKDFDGVIAFDEAHNMGNATDIKGERGQKDAAQKAVAGMQLQDRLPNARVVYVSATGATEVSNLAYADRLGLWGRGTAFASQARFVSEVEKGGIAAMELIARDMKQLGLYTARNLSYDGVEYERLEHKLDTNQREIYDTLAEAWQVVLRNINAALEVTGGNMDSRAKSAAMSAFWGGHQRFFNQVITSLQMPSVIKAVEKDIAAGRQVVLQLTNTNEASQERAAAKAKTAEEIEDLDITPRDQIIQLVENSFPTQEYEQYVDENGKEASRPVTDKDGNPVQNKQALRLREALIDRLASVRVPQGPLDMVLDHFGTDVVAEVTGRGRRFVMATDEKTGQRRRMEETRPGSSNLSETDAFQSGQKKALIFSEAGGTGRSYHADNTSASKDARRVHYLVQGGWRADKAVQGFGRTHRTNQASAPVFKLVTTDLQGQKRFISSIARRLGQLGALTKGERKAGDQGVFTARDNLESAEAHQALQQFFHDLLADGVPGVPLAEFEQQTGLKLRSQDEEGRVTSINQNLPPITQFLNRLLSLKVEMQNRVFEAFSDRLDAVIEARAQAGLLDVGLETVRADKIAKESERIVHTVEESNAETKYIKLRLSDRFTPIDFDTIADNKSRKVLFWARSPKDKVYAVAEAPSVTDDNGNIVDHYRIINPVSGGRIIPRNNINQSEGKWVKIDKSGAEKLWNKEIAEAPEFVTRDMHLITGAILPVWDRLGGMARVVRLQTDEGERLLGRVVPTGEIAGTLKKLGVEAAATKVNPDKLFDSLMAGGRATLTNGWTLSRRMVAHEHRIELSGPASFSEGNEVKQDGVFTERIDYKVRYFVSTDPVEGKKVLAAITKYRPVAEMNSAGPDEEELGAAMAMSPQDADLAALVKYWGNRTFENEEAARAYIKSRIVENNEKYPMFKATDPAIVDRMVFVRSGNSVKLSQRGMATRKPVEIFDEPTGRAPRVNWSGQDLVHNGTPESAFKEYGRGVGEVRSGYVNIDDLPKDKLAGGKEQYDWSELQSSRSAPPPVTIRINKNGTTSILDGNHRINYWRDQGYEQVPAFIIDERPHAEMGRPTPTTAFRQIGKAIPPELLPQDTGFTREFELRQTEIAQHLTELIHRITGKRIAVRFRDEITLGQSAPGWGNDARGARTIGGAYLPLSDIIRIALADHRFPDKATVAFHESWHAVEDHFALDQEMALLKREEPRLRAVAASFYGLKPEQIAGIADFEIRSMAFQAYAADREAGGTGAGMGLHIGIRRFFERLFQLFRRIRNYLRGLGFQTSEDIFAKAYEGGMKERLSRKLDEGKGSRIADQLLAERAKQSGAAMAKAPKEPPEKVIAAAVRVNGRVFAGIMHADALESAEKAVGWKLGDPEEQGFITSNGRFVDRKEALEIAKHDPKNGLPEHGKTAELHTDHMGPWHEADIDRNNQALTDATRDPNEVIDKPPDDDFGAAMAMSPRPRPPGSIPRSIGERIRDRIAAILDSRLAGKIAEGYQDLSAPVKKLQNELEERRGAPFNDLGDFYTRKRLYPGRVGNEVDLFNKAHLDPMVATMKAHAISLVQAGDYVYAKHVAERNAELGRLYPAAHQFHRAMFDRTLVGASGRSREWAENILREVARLGKTAQYEQVARHIAAIREYVLHKLVDGGLITPATAAEWRAKYQHYVDLRGYEDEHDEAPSDYRDPARFHVRGKEIKQAFGRGSKADNPIVNMLDQAYRSIDRAERNRYLHAVWNAFGRMQADNPGSISDIVKLDRGKRKKVIDPRTGLVKEVSDSSYAGSPNTVSMKIAGIPHHMVFENRDMAEAVKRMAPEGLGMFQGLLVIQNKLKSLWTHYSPDFLFRHFMFRYPIEGTLNSFEQKASGDHSVTKYLQEGLPFIGSASKAIFASNKGTPHADPEIRAMQAYWQEMRQAGGAMMFRNSRDMDLLREHLQTQLLALKGKPYATAREKWRRAIEAMDVVTNALDNSLRLAAYASARRQGKTPQQAALIAREATVDFQLKGKWANAIGLWFPFGNVAIQTGMRMTKAVGRSKIMRRVFMGTMLAGFLTAAFNYLIGGDDTDGVPFFEKLPEWDRRLNFIILNPFDKDDKGRPTPIKIPMPYNWAFPLMIGYGFGTTVFGKESLRKTLGTVIHSGLEVATPFGQEENKAAMLAPELARPFVHIYTNQDYTGRPVHQNPDFQKGPNAESGRKDIGGRVRTGEGWKYIARSLNGISGGSRNKSGHLDFYPEDIRHIFDYVGGTQRRLLGNIYETGQSIGSGKAPDPTHVPLERVIRGTDYDASDRALRYERQQQQKHPWLH